MTGTDEEAGDRLAAVRQRIDRACTDSGRDPAEVRLMAVSKTHPPELLRDTYAAGQRLFGENKVQEASSKAEQLADLSELRWAFVGHLQTNKAKDLLRFAAEFHALDSFKVATALDRRLQQEGRSLDVFLEVNSSAEPSKFGLPPEAVPDFAVELAACSSLRVRGLMTLAAHSPEQEVVAACFARMRTLQDRLRHTDRARGTYDELSMGMSDDYELAIAYGATTVRIGTALFGSRRTPAAR